MGLRGRGGARAGRRGWADRAARAGRVCAFLARLSCPCPLYPACVTLDTRPRRQVSTVVGVSCVSAISASVDYSGSSSMALHASTRKVHDERARTRHKTHTEPTRAVRAKPGTPTQARSHEPDQLSPRHQKPWPGLWAGGRRQLSRRSAPGALEGLHLPASGYLHTRATGVNPAPHARRGRAQAYPRQQQGGGCAGDAGRGRGRRPRAAGARNRGAAAYCCPPSGWSCRRPPGHLPPWSARSSPLWTYGTRGAVAAAPAACLRASIAPG